MLSVKEVKILIRFTSLSVTVKAEVIIFKEFNILNGH